MKKTKTIFGEIKPGDWVIAAENNDYCCLIGVVLEIDELDSEEHCTENNKDDIHVDFTAFLYPPEYIQLIEKHFSNLYGITIGFSELPLDNVIMSPNMLIRIAHSDDIEIVRKENKNYALPATA